MMKRAIRGTLLFPRHIPHGSPIDFVFNLTERFFDRLISMLLAWDGSLGRGCERVPKKGISMYQLEYLPIEIGCVCEAKGEGKLGYCFETATAYDAEADETGPIYFCEAHRPDTDTDTSPSYPTN